MLDPIATLKGYRYVELRRLFLQWFRCIVLQETKGSIDIKKYDSGGNCCMCAEAKKSLELRAWKR